MTRGRHLLGALALAASATIALPAHSASAATFVVTNLDNSGAGSLRDALDQANDTTARDVITFADGLSGLLTLNSPLSVSEAVDIIGPGQDVVAITTNDASGILSVQADIVVEGLTVEGGMPGISAQSGADVTVRESALHGNESSDPGGAISTTSGDVVVESSTFTRNTGDRGGAIATESGSVMVTTSTFTNNDSDDSGGAIYSGGSVSVVDSVIEENDADESGGGIWADGDIEITSSMIRKNTAGDRGGGIAVSGDGVFTAVVFRDNAAVGPGGAVSSDSDVRAVLTRFEANSSQLNGGAIAVDKSATIAGALFVENDARNVGGAVFVRNDNLHITASAFQQNTARFGGAVYYDSPAGEFTIDQTTMSENEASEHGGAIFSVNAIDAKLSTFANNTAVEQGGAIWVRPNTPADASFSFVTVVENDAESGGGIFFADPGTLDHAVVASNVATNGPDVYGDVEADWSLISDWSDATFSPLNNLESDAGLGPLADNGALVEVDVAAVDGGFDPEVLGLIDPPTMVPLVDSPLIDAGDPARPNLNDDTIDQRGGQRLVGAAVDIGAVEARPTDRAAWFSLTPARLLDTRSSGETIDGLSQRDGARAAGSRLELQVSGRGGVPIGAAAAIVNITAVAPSAVGFVTVWDCNGEAPLASSLNHTRGVNLGNEIIAQLDVDGRLCLFTSASTHLTVDVVGHLDARGPYVTAAPVRLVDTRSGNETIDGRFAGEGRRPADSELRVQIAGRGGIPDDAASVTMNITAIGSTATGFVTVHACEDARPLASSLNYAPGANRGNEITAQLNDAGEVCIYTDQSIHITVDAIGHLVADSDASNVEPARLIDTRANGSTIDDNDEGGGFLTAGAVTELTIGGRAGVPSQPVTATLNITAVNPQAVGFMTVFRCNETRPLASNLNYTPGINGASDIIVALPLPSDDDPSTICIYNDTPTNLIVDITGYTTIR